MENTTSPIAPAGLIKKYYSEAIILLLAIFMFKDISQLWIKEWTDFDSFYGLGLFVIGFNIYYIKTNFQELKDLSKAVCPSGMFLVLPSLLAYIAGIRASLDYVTSFAFPCLIAGVILTLYGYKMLSKLFIPILLLALALPILPLHRITMPLQLVSTSLSADTLRFLGLAAIDQGNILFVNGLRMAVVAGCSGLKSLFSLLFVTIICSYLENVKLWKKVLYIALVVPFAIAMNVVRIVVTAFYGVYNGYEGLESFHDQVGIVVNIISIAIIVLSIRFFEKKEEQGNQVIQ